MNGALVRLTKCCFVNRVERTCRSGALHCSLYTNRREPSESYSYDGSLEHCSRLMYICNIAFVDERIAPSGALSGSPASLP
jgi:hypothetical protein